MDPISLALTAGSAIMGFMGNMQQGEAAQQASQYQAQVQRNNEITARNNAAYSAQAGAVRAQTQDFKNRAVLGSIEAAQGASGIDFGSETSEDVRRSARQVARLDTETLYNNALLTANQSLTQATNFRAEASLSEFEGENARRAGMMKGFGSLIGGATSFASKWSKYQNSGMEGYGSAF